jgi:hypothetical protein
MLICIITNNKKHRVNASRHQFRDSMWTFGEKLTSIFTVARRVESADLIS